MTVQFPFLRLSSVLKPHCSKSNVVLVFCFSLTGIYSAVMYASDDDAHRAVRSGRHGLRYLMTAEFAFHTTTKLIENWSLKCLHVSLICYIITSGKRQMTRKATTMKSKMTKAQIRMAINMSTRADWYLEFAFKVSQEKGNTSAMMIIGAEMARRGISI